MKKRVCVLLFTAFVFLIVPQLLFSQPLPPGEPGGGGGGVAGAPVDGGAWILPVALALYYRFKKESKA